MICYNIKKESKGDTDMRKGTEKKLYLTRKILSSLLIAVMSLTFSPSFATAENDNTEIVGKVYEFGKDSHYEFHEEKQQYQLSDTYETYGSLMINGEVTEAGKRSNVPSYRVDDGSLNLSYNYSDEILNADTDSWHLVDDDSKKVADFSLGTKIKKGAIILQISNDRKNWINEKMICNAFEDVPVRTEPIYTASDIQLINGCFYRIIVVYEVSIRIEKKNYWFVNADKYDYKKIAEVYEFYAYKDDENADAFDPNHTYNLGSTVRTERFDGYYGEDMIEKKDPHYGWDLGNFFVSGYTEEVTDSGDNVVFLKNVGDKVTLWFSLNQNINALDGDKELSITADKEGYDQYFWTPTMDFGRGTLIIRHTDHNHKKSDPIIYTNFLEANASIGADTKVQLFEEGDYEVALDYEVTRNDLFPDVGHYRIFFEFSIRNGNCMVYPFDVRTGSELTNSAYTENGFRLDLARSRYLDINVKMTRWVESTDGLVEDVRFNRPAKDGEQYEEEGIYTITVNNKVTGQETSKKIYVGKDKILRAHVVTGRSIQKIKELVAGGAIIREDGTLDQDIPTPTPEPTPMATPTVEPTTPVVTPEPTPAPSTDDDKINGLLMAVMFLGGVICGIIISGVTVLIYVSVNKKKEKTNKTEERSKEE